MVVEARRLHEVGDGEPVRPAAGPCVANPVVVPWAGNEQNFLLVARWQQQTRLHDRNHTRLIIRRFSRLKIRSDQF